MTARSPSARIHGWYGSFLCILRAYVYILYYGRERLAQIAENAVLNANYLRVRLGGDYDVAYPEICMHECVFTARRQQRAKGVRALDIAKRLMDYGYHPPTIYFPLIVPEALMIEPTETESRETLDAFVEAMHQIAREIEDRPGTGEVRAADDARAEAGRGDRRPPALPLLDAGGTGDVMAQWRWRQETEPGTPDGNMAADAALLRELRDDPDTLPIVRVYAWDRPCVSIGRLQDEAAVRAAFPGLPLVRRPTGGRAVRHGDDLTVSVAARLSDLPLDGGARRSADVPPHRRRLGGCLPVVRDAGGVRRGPQPRLACPPWTASSLPPAATSWTGARAGNWPAAPSAGRGGCCCSK